MTKVRPFLKWAGSKYRYLDAIVKFFPSANRLIEPFTGSGAIFLNSNFASYLLAENNKDLVSIYQFLKVEGEEFIDYCGKFFSLENNCSEKYYYFRDEFNQTSRKRYKAALFLYLNRHGYNGLCRYNQSGFFNVPFGRHIKPYFPRLEMLNFYLKSEKACIVKNDFRLTFLQAQQGDLIYCDPPYVPLSLSSGFNAYTNKKFDAQDQIDLADLAKESAKKGVPVIISNHDTPFTRHYYQESEIISFPVKRYISCLAYNRGLVPELIAIFK